MRATTRRAGAGKTGTFQGPKRAARAHRGEGLVPFQAYGATKSKYQIKVLPSSVRFSTEYCKYCVFMGLLFAAEGVLWNRERSWFWGLSNAETIFAKFYTNRCKLFAMAPEACRKH